MGSPGQPGPPHAHLTNILGALSLAISDLLTEDAASRGLSAHEESALILAEVLEGPSQETVRQRLGLSQPGTARLIDRLTSRGLMVRAPGPDQRTRALRLTQPGRALARDALARREPMIGRLLAGLSQGEQADLARSLENMLTTLVTEGASATRVCRLCDQAACTAGGAECPVESARQAAGQ